MACGGRRKGLSYWGSSVNPSKVRLRVGRRRQEGKRKGERGEDEGEEQRRKKEWMY